MSKRILIAVIGLVLFFNNSVLAKDAKQGKSIDKELNDVIVSNFTAYQEENIDDVMKTVHTKSPGFEATREFSAQVFPVYDIKYELVNFKYVATEGEFALARVKQKTTKISGPEFMDNVIDSIVIFKQEDGVWKLWSQATLTLEYI